MPETNEIKLIIEAFYKNIRNTNLTPKFRENLSRQRKGGD